MRRASRSFLVVGLGALWITVACTTHLPDQDLRILDAHPAAKTSPESVLKEYQTDGRAAGRTYHGRAIDVSGKVSAIVQDAPSRILFTPDPKPNAISLEARLLDDRAAATLKDVTVGQRLTLRCFVEGLDKNVVLKSCIRP